MRPLKLATLGRIGRSPLSIGTLGRLSLFEPSGDSRSALSRRIFDDDRVLMMFVDAFVRQA